MVKVYGYKNTSEVMLRIPIKKTILEFNFVGGNPNLKEPVPATYSTRNPIRQYVLEHCNEFINGRIYIESQYEESIVKGEDGVEKKEVKEVKAEIVPVEEVTTKAEAVEYLKGLGVKATSLRIESRIREAAKINNVSFPNWKEEE